MSSTQMSSDTATDGSGVATVPMRFEVTLLPVADADRAKAFYQGLGWRLDIDFKPSESTRAVQFTPPGSPASIQFGEGLTAAAPGSAQGLLLIVDDIDAARDGLIGGGAEVSELWHTEPGKGPTPGRDPEGRSYFTRASFADPDGNGWQLQEIKERLPGRGGGPIDVASLSQLLHETAEHHGSFEAAAPPHDWWDWYAAYFDAREGGSTPDEADAAADRYMAEVKGVVASRP